MTDDRLYRIAIGDRTPIEVAADHLLATYYRTMPAWMRALDDRLRWFRHWRRRPYVALPRWWPR